MLVLLAGSVQMGCPSEVFKCLAPHCFRSAILFRTGSHRNSKKTANAALPSTVRTACNLPHRVKSCRTASELRSSDGSSNCLLTSSSSNCLLTSRMMSNVKGMTATARAAANNQAIIELLTRHPSPRKGYRCQQRLHYDSL